MALGTITLWQIEGEQGLHSLNLISAGQPPNLDELLCCCCC